MNATTHAVSFYYAVLLWAVILYGAGVLFKVATVFLYEALMPWFADENAPPRRRPERLAPNQAVVWWGLGAYLLLSGVAQIPPQTALASRITLARILETGQWGIGLQLTRAWIHMWWIHPIMYNVASFMVQAVLGIFLLTERNTRLGRVTAALTFLYAMAIGLFPQGIGYILSAKNSLAAGAPGSGFLTAALALSLLLPTSAWKSPELPNLWRRGLVVIVGLGTVWQFSFFAHRRIEALFAHSPALISHLWLMAPVITVRTLAVHQGFLLNWAWILGLAVLAWAPHFSSWSIRWLPLAILAAFWWLGQALGTMASFGLGLGTAPLWAIALGAVWRSPSE